MPTVADLFRSAGARLRVDFESARESSLHAAQTGAEIEEILRKFLNEHLPQRFRSASAFLIDSENATSRQCDVAIYDAIGSPILRASPIQQILPVDHVAAVIEVKSSLSKTELADSYEKIASCKRLKKTTLSEVDRSSTGSRLSTIAMMGIVFGFDSVTSLDALAENAKELNAQYESKLWPDLVCVLDKGSITYVAQFAQGNRAISMAMPPCTDDFIIPAAYQMLSVTTDGPLTLNRLMALLLSQLTFFAHRPSSLRFDQLLEAAPKETKVVQGYMYDTARRLQVVPPELDGKGQPPSAQFRVTQATDGKVIGQLAFFKWQDGGYVLGRGMPPLGLILALVFPGQSVDTFPAGDSAFSSVLNLTEAQFLRWPELFQTIPPLAAITLELIDAAG